MILPYIVKIAIGKTVTDAELEDGLYEICDNTHASCNSNCPVYVMNGERVPDTAYDFSNRGCDCFKDGKKMLEWIRNQKNWKIR